MTSSADAAPALVSVVELGGYPDFSPLYRRLGYAPQTATNGRKAQALIRSLQPAAVVAEFNFQTDFRDRTSWLESLLAVLQAMPETRVVVFYDPAQSAQLERLQARFAGFTALAYPIDEQALEAALRGDT